MILLNQAGKTSHQDICELLELFAKEVMPEFHAAEAEHVEWKRKVLAREIVLEDLDVPSTTSTATRTSTSSASRPSSSSRRWRRRKRQRKSS